MSTMERRLKNLEDYRAAETKPDPATADVRHAQREYGLALACVAPLLTEEDLDRVVTVLGYELSITVAIVRGTAIGCKQVARPAEQLRFPWCVLTLLASTPMDLRPAVVADMHAFIDAVHNERPLAEWPEGHVYWLVHSMALLTHRLPPDIDPEALRRVLDVCLREEELDSSPVCPACGLYWPSGEIFRDPRAVFFAACPHCGGTERADDFKWWEFPFAWQKQAADELLELRAQAQRLEAEQAKAGT